MKGTLVGDTKPTVLCDKVSYGTMATKKIDIRGKAQKSLKSLTRTLKHWRVPQSSGA